MNLFSRLIVLTATTLLNVENARAQEGESLSTPPAVASPETTVRGATPLRASESASSSGESGSSSPKPTRKAKRGEVKETEGTTAPERFEGNTILKSQYYLEGQSLEVDPD